MDAELGRLVAAFEATARRRGARILVVADHGEGRGEHGETLHGNLLYQGVMRVPLIVAGGGRVGHRARGAHRAGERAAGLRHLPRLGGRASAREPAAPPGRAVALPVLGEAMQPFLHYRWQPQMMAVEGSTKVIRSGRIEVFDVEKDSGEEKDLGEAALHDRLFGRELARRSRPIPLPRRSPLRRVRMARIPVRSARRTGAACRASAISPVLRPPLPARPACPLRRHGPRT